MFSHYKSLTLWAIILLGAASGCATTPGHPLATTTSQPTNDLIARCNAGLKVTTSAQLEAKITRNLTMGVSADAGISQEVKGLFMNNQSGDKLTGQEQVAMYTEYVKCLNGKS